MLSRIVREQCKNPVREIIGVSFDSPYKQDTRCKEFIMKTRPIGITILAVLGFLSVLFYLIMTVIALVNPAQANNLLQGMSGGGAGPAALQQLAAILPAYFLVTGLISGGLSWGLWNLKTWARIVCLVLIVISVIGGAVGIAAAWSHSTVPATISALVRLLIAILIFVYLNSPRVREAFHPSS